MRSILSGFGGTAIRTIRIDARGSGVGFSYTIAVPAEAVHRGVLGFQGEWEAAMVGESYAAVRADKRLPRLAFQAFSDILPNGNTIGLSAGVGTDYGGHLQTLPSEQSTMKRVKQAAASARFTVRYVGVIRPFRALPVIFVTTDGHSHIERRLEGFLGHVLPTPQVNLAYVQLDTTCGRPIFARGQGIAVDSQWFDICDFSVGCPSYGNPSGRLTYPC